MHQLSLTADGAGRLTLPETVLKEIGIHPKEEVVLEWNETEAVIRPKTAPASVTERIAAMNLPVGEWDEMKAEIQAGRSR